MASTTYFSLPQMRKWKADDPQLKVLFAIGGWNHAADSFTKMVASSKYRALFIKSTVTFLLKHSKFVKAQI